MSIRLKFVFFFPFIWSYPIFDAINMPILLFRQPLLLSSFSFFDFSSDVLSTRHLLAPMLPDCSFLIKLTGVVGLLLLFMCTICYMCTWVADTAAAGMSTIGFALDVDSTLNFMSNRSVFKDLPFTLKSDIWGATWGMRKLWLDSSVVIVCVSRAKGDKSWITATAAGSTFEGTFSSSCALSFFSLIHIYLCWCREGSTCGIAGGSDDSSVIAKPTWAFDPGIFYKFAWFTLLLKGSFLSLPVFLISSNQCLNSLFWNLILSPTFFIWLFWNFCFMFKTERY